MFRSLLRETPHNASAMLPSEFVCPKCKQPGKLKAEVVSRWHVPISPPASFNIPKEDPGETFIQKVYCDACDFSAELNTLRVIHMHQPTCKSCKLSGECASAGAELYGLSAHLCPDFRWKV